MVVDHQNNAHVIPMSAVRGVINGTYPPANLGDDVLRRIVEEWLELTAEKQHASK
ncbi:hypothetical protein phiK7B1_157 [Pseudomonas phage phiK7B1]|nr:hypothetical protein phiK7B1_157 [Pseudomonas phage phiK7B1]